MVIHPRATAEDKIRLTGRPRISRFDQVEGYPADA